MAGSHASAGDRISGPRPNHQGARMSDEHDTRSPDEPSEKPAPEAQGKEPSPSKPLPAGERPSLLDGFDEDEDFDTAEKPRARPEVPRVVKPMPWTGKDEAKPREELLRSRLGGWKMWCAVTGVLLVCAAVLTAIRLAGAGFWTALAGVLLVFYHALVHSVTGTAAVYAAAWSGSRRVASIETAAARMGAAVAALLLVQSIETGLFAGRLEEMAMGTVAYLAVILAAFRLDRTLLLILAGSHAGLWMILSLGHVLARQVPAVVPSAGP